ncbi:HNH endonuclease signature motif containing protein [Streptomyces anthocyanicus]
MKATPPLDRIRARTIRDENGCWVYTGHLDPAGYGRISVLGADSKRRGKFTHRVTYEALVGPIPPSLHIDHLCRNRACCNPKHLEPVTPLVNTRRSPISTGSVNAAKTRCSNGHDFSPENTRIVVNRRGRAERVCKACVRIRSAKYRRSLANRERRAAPSKAVQP